MRTLALLLIAGATLAEGCRKDPVPTYWDSDFTPAEHDGSGGEIQLDDLGPWPDPPFSETCDERPPPNALGNFNVGQGGASGETLSDGGAGGADRIDEEPGAATDGRCGCDGQHYQTEEEALASGASLDPYDHCEIDEAHFGCGFGQCLVGAQGCGAVISHANCCEEQGFVCFDLPEPCLDLPEDESPCACFRDVHGEYYYGTCTETATSQGWAMYHTIFDGL